MKKLIFGFGVAAIVSVSVLLPTHKAQPKAEASPAIVVPMDWDYYFNASPYGGGDPSNFGSCYTWWCY